MSPLEQKPAAFVWGRFFNCTYEQANILLHFGASLGIVLAPDLAYSIGAKHWPPPSGSFKTKCACLLQSQQLGWSEMLEPYLYLRLLLCDIFKCHHLKATVSCVNLQFKTTLVVCFMLWNIHTKPFRFISQKRKKRQGASLKNISKLTWQCYSSQSLNPNTLSSEKTNADSTRGHWVSVSSLYVDFYCSLFQWCSWAWRTKQTASRRVCVLQERPVRNIIRQSHSAFGEWMNYAQVTVINPRSR